METTDETALVKKQEHNQLLAEVQAVARIESPEQYQKIAGYRATFGAGVKYFDGLYLQRIDAANKLHKGLIADLKGLKEPSESGWKYSGQLLADFDRRAVIEQKRLQIEAEAKANREAEEERKRLLEVAKDLKDKELIKEIKAMPLEPDPVVIEKQTPKVEGLSYRENWWFKITDATKIPREYLCVDEVKIGKIVRALKQEANIPGVEVGCDKIAVQK